MITTMTDYERTEYVRLITKGIKEGTIPTIVYEEEIPSAYTPVYVHRNVIKTIMRK